MLNTNIKTRVGSDPILAICIPTFNRAGSLLSLLSQIQSFYFDWQGLLEVCVSNNCSTDNTDDVIQSFKEKIPGIKYIVQSQNIGGSFNVGEVVKLAAAKYILLCGDDDLINTHDLAELMRRLSVDRGEYWYILNGGAFRWNPIANFCSLIFRSLGSSSSKIYISLVGLSSLGFLGTHVMPRCVVGFVKEQHVLKGWPSISYLLSYLAKSEAACLKLSRLQVINQSASGVLLFWYPDEMFRVAIGRVRIINQTLRQSNEVLWSILVCRELFSPATVFHLLSIRFMYRRDGYNKYQRSIIEVLSERSAFENAALRVQSVVAWLVMAMPDMFLRFVVPFSIRRKISDLNKRTDTVDKSFNGLSRGL